MGLQFNTFNFPKRQYRIGRSERRTSLKVTRNYSFPWWETESSANQGTPSTKQSGLPDFAVAKKSINQILFVDLSLPPGGTFGFSVACSNIFWDSSLLIEDLSDSSRNLSLCTQHYFLHKGGSKIPHILGGPSKTSHHLKQHVKCLLSPDLVMS